MTGATASRPKPRARGLGPAPREGRIEVARAGGCVSATLDRPGARNRLSAAMARRLVELAEEVEDDDGALMLAIRGTRADFCAGFDDDVDPAVVESLAVLTKPTLAIIGGAAADEGMELALAMDLRVASAGARFTMGQLARGRLPRFGGTQRLPRLVGVAHAMRMLLTGATVDGREAMRLGLVTYLAPSAGALERTADEVVRALSSRGPVAARMAKEAVRRGADLTLDQGIRLEEDLYALLQTTADRAEGVRAFLEKRKPLFRGA
ncbi:MAG TPA: enoyl-CoA hydratase-related protein [Candidatus Binataceae bacterium]|nr:enoyl-CoA hydratase-related protein [Candidatus Binataceae bacterium]